MSLIVNSSHRLSKPKSDHESRIGQGRRDEFTIQLVTLQCADCQIFIGDCDE